MTLIPNTYNGLVSAIRALAEDDSQEFLNYIPTAIFLAEERLIKELDLVDLESSAGITGVVSTATLAKPAGYRLGFDLSYITSTGRKFLTKKTDDYLRDYWPVESSVGHPKYYSDDGKGSFLVAPAPASAYSFKVKYLGTPTKLSTGNQTNVFTSTASDALYYATMSNMGEFMKDYEVQQVWEVKYDAARGGLHNQARRQRRDDATNPLNPSVNKNTLKGEN